MNSRLISIIRKEFIQIFRDKRTLALILVIPLLELFLLGYAATNDVRNVPMAVVDQSRGPEARALLDAYRAADYFKLNYFVNSNAEMQALIQNGSAKAGLIIPPDYAAQLNKGSAQVAFILDGSDPTVATTALSAAQLIGQDHATGLMVSKFSRAGQGSSVHPPVEVRTTVWYNPDMNSSYFMIPGLIGLILTAIIGIVTATSVVRERERGTIEQLIVTPIRAWELVVGKILPYTVLGLLDAMVIVGVGHWWFGVPVNGSLGLIFILTSVYLLSTLGIGLFASTVANTQQEAMLTVFMTILPSIFISGFIYPLAAMPVVLQWISYLIPLRYFLTIIRALMVKGVGLESILPDVIAMSIFGVVIMGAAALRFRKRLD